MIPFIDVAAQRRRLGTAIDDAVARVLDALPVHARPGGAGVRAGAGRVLRRAPCGRAAPAAPTRWCWRCAPRASGRGDAVFCPSFTFCATAEVVALVGATPVFVDVARRDLQHRRGGLAAAIGTAKRLGLDAEGGHPGRSVRPAGRSRRHRGGRASREPVGARRCGAGFRRRPTATASSAPSAT